MLSAPNVRFWCFCKNAYYVIHSARMPVSPLQAVVLGVVQGLTEFLPVSSSAHLILIPRFFHWDDPGLAFDVALHLGTLAAVVLYFWKDLLGLAKGFVNPSNPAGQADRATGVYLVLATIPGALAGFLLEHKAES